MRGDRRIVLSSGALVRNCVELLEETGGVKWYPQMVELGRNTH
jgi:hypothetical protein